MKREKLLTIVKNELDESRYRHTLRVAETAVQLAHRFGADPEKADVAALLHDYSKCWPKEKLRQWIVEHKIGYDLLQHSPALWHAFVGAEAVREQLGVEDEDILNAIRYHTSGRPNMTVLEKVVCLADYIEPGRDFPGVQEVRELAEHDLDGALYRSLNNTLLLLIKNNRKLYPLTVEARNDLLKEES